MMPTIAYARTRDNVLIAYCTIGSGYPLVLMPSPIRSDVLKEWLIPSRRQWIQELSKHFQVVQYDGRGLGHSDHDVDDFSMDSMLLDIQAVVQELGLSDFALFSHSFVSPIAIRYASRFQDVKHLVLWNPVTRSCDAFAHPEAQAICSLARTNWELFALTSTSSTAGWSLSDDIRDYADIASSMGQALFERVLESILTFDATNDLSNVEAHTLVIHRRSYHMINMQNSHEIVSQIPKAELRIVEGVSGFPTDPPVVSEMLLFMDNAGRFRVEDPEAPIFSPLYGRSMPSLTFREAEVLRVVGEGKTNAEAAIELSMSARTVEHHLANVYHKSGTHSRLEAVLMYQDRDVPN